ncbi:TPA: bifunctional UDP-sugar hydrolase/5'-nucleotidase, partial [Pasteurella multocida]
MKKLTKLSAIALSLGLISQAYAYTQDKTYNITVLHANDTHGHFWKNSHGEYGFAAHKTLIDNIRKEVEGKGGSVILLHAGDFNTGVPESDMQ